MSGTMNDVSAIRCPNKACQKYQLVESVNLGKTIPCLICKQPIQIPAGKSAVAAAAAAPIQTKQEVDLDQQPKPINPPPTEKQLPKAIRLPNM